MNQDQTAGRWQQIKGRAKKAWGELTDDDFLKAEGSIDKLAGIIREKVGDSEASIRARLADDDDGDGQWLQVKGRAKQAWGELTDDPALKARGAADQAKGKRKERVADDRSAADDLVDRPKVR